MFVVYSYHWTDAGTFEFSAPRIVHPRGLSEVREWLEEQLSIALNVPTRKHTSALLETKSGNFRLTTPQVVTHSSLMVVRVWLAEQLREIENRFTLERKAKLASKVREMEREAETAALDEVVVDFDIPIVQRRPAKSKRA